MPPQSAGRRSQLEQVSVWVLIATIVLGVVFAWPTSNISTNTLKAFILSAGTLLSFGVYILARLSRGNVILPPMKLLAVLGLPALAYVLSATFSQASFVNTLWGTALESDTLGFMLAATVLGVLVALVIRRPEHYKTFLKVGTLTVGAVAALQTLILLVSQVVPSVIAPSFNLLGSYDDLATFMGLGVVGILLAFRFLSFEKRERQFLLVSGALALFLLAVSNSGSAWVMVALVSLGLFVESVMRRGPKQADLELDDVVTMGDSSSEAEETGKPLALPLGVLALSLFFLIGGALGSALAQSFHLNLVSVRPSWQSTFQVAQKTYAVSPLFGSGPNTFGVEWLKYRDATLNSTAFWNVDFFSGIGFIPTSLVTTGAVGLIAWVAFLGLLLVLGLRMVILRAPQDHFIRFVAILSLVASVYLFANAVVALPNPALLVLAFVSAGLFVSTTRYAAWSQQWGVVFAKSPRLGFVIVFGMTLLLLGSVVASYHVAGRYVATRQVANAASLYSAGSLDAADQAAQNATSFGPVASAYQVQAGVALSRLNQIVSSTTLPAAQARQAFQNALSSGINAGLTATRLTPDDYRTWLAIGNLYAQAVPLGVSGAYDSAKAAYQKAADLNPTSPQIPFVMAQLDIAARNFTSAEDNLKKAVALKQDFAAAIFLLSQVEVQVGNVKDALASSLAAAYFQPNDPNILFQVGLLYAAQNDFQNAELALAAAITVNPQFANARYFLAAVEAKLGKFSDAAAQLESISGMSADNAKAVAPQLAALRGGKNPFPANLLSVNPTTVKQ